MSFLQACVSVKIIISEFKLCKKRGSSNLLVRTPLTRLNKLLTFQQQTFNDLETIL